MGSMSEPNVQTPEELKQWNRGQDRSSPVQGLDAMKWAEAMMDCQLGGNHGAVPVETTALWFACAIMAGFDEGQRRAQAAAQGIPGRKECLRLLEDSRFELLRRDDEARGLRERVSALTELIRTLVHGYQGPSAIGQCSMLSMAERIDEFLAQQRAQELQADAQAGVKIPWYTGPFPGMKPTEATAGAQAEAEA